MKCRVCATGNIIYDLEETTTAYLGKLDNGNYVIIENVPCLKCPNCGEEYFLGSVSVKIEAIINKYNDNAKKVAVTDYKKAAIKEAKTLDPDNAFDGSTQDFMYIEETNLGYCNNDYVKKA